MNLKRCTPKPTAPPQGHDAPVDHRCAVQTAASTVMNIGGPVALEAQEPAVDLMNEFSRKPLMVRRSPIKEGLSFSLTSTSGFVSGLTVHLEEKGVEIGKFSVVRTEDGFENDVEVAEEHRGRDAGVALLLLALQEANNNEIGFEMDHRGINDGQKAVYASAEKRGLIDPPVMGCTGLTEAGEAYLEERNLAR